jgi:sulfide:quinone oxidoreductase
MKNAYAGGRDRVRAVIAGAGIAGLETLVALRELAGDRLDVALIDPAQTFRVRALAVGEPFGLGAPRRYAIAQLAADLGAVHVRDAVSRVDAAAGAVMLRSAHSIDFDVLVLAVGATPRPWLRGGVLLDPDGGGRALTALRGELEAADSARVVVAVPAEARWTLPAYEVALMLAGIAGVDVTVVTPEREPLEIVGGPVSRAVRDELRAGGVSLVTGETARMLPGGSVAVGDGHHIAATAVVQLPRLIGPGIAGVPCDRRGFIQVDPAGRVHGLADVFAVGDGAGPGIAQGGLAAQQADAIAVAIARRAGASVAEDPPSPPVLRAVMRTRRGPRYIRADLEPGGSGEVSEHSLWWPPTKVAASWLMPWLSTRQARPAPGTRHRPSVGWWQDPPRGHRAEPLFRRSLGGERARAVVLRGRTAGPPTWALTADDGADDDDSLTLQGALALLRPADRVGAVAAHRAALNAACAALAGLHSRRRWRADALGLRRLTELAAGIADLAGQLESAQESALTAGEPVRDVPKPSPVLERDGAAGAAT